MSITPTIDRETTYSYHYRPARPNIRAPHIARVPLSSTTNILADPSLAVLYKVSELYEPQDIKLIDNAIVDETNSGRLVPSDRRRLTTEMWTFAMLDSLASNNIPFINPMKGWTELYHQCDEAVRGRGVGREQPVVVNEWPGDQLS